MKLTNLLAASGCMVALTPALSRAQDTFTFDTQPTSGIGSYPFSSVGPPPFFLISYAPKTLAADNNPARIATFSVSGSPTPAISYEFQQNNMGGTNYGENLQNVILENVDNNPTDVLTMTFAQPITSISLDFAVANFTGGTTPDASLSLNGVTGTGVFNMNSGNFEGMLSFTAAPFTVATLSFIPGPSGDNGYAIDNIMVTPTASAVPEPGIIALALAGFVPVAGLLRRRRAR